MKAYEDISENAQYKLLSFDDQSQAINVGDLIEFKSLYLTNKKDTIYPDSTFLNEIYNDTLTFQNNLQLDVFRLFKNLQENDSCLVQFNTHSDFMNRLHKKYVNTKETDTINLYIKVKNIYKGQSKTAYLLEQNAIARYITFSQKKWQATESGIFFHITKPGDGNALALNETVKIAYKGYFLNGQVFDNYTLYNPYFEYKIGIQSQLIRGLEIALKHLNKGSEGEFIIPSNLAFGSQGSSTGIVSAYKPLLYKIQVLKN